MTSKLHHGLLSNSRLSLQRLGNPYLSLLNKYQNPLYRLLFENDSEFSDPAFEALVASSIPALWVKADSLSLSDGDKVSTWADSGDNSRDLIQGTVGSQPTYKTNIINGYPVVRFTGSSLSGSSYSAGNFLSVTATQPSEFSVFAVYRAAVANTFSIAASWGPGGAGTFWTGYYRGSPPKDGHLIPISDSSVDLYSASNLDTDWHVVSGIRSGTTSYAYENGVFALSGTTTALNGSTIFIGKYPSGLFWNGDIAEAIFFSTALNTVNQQIVENYLMTKYAITA